MLPNLSPNRYLLHEPLHPFSWGQPQALPDRGPVHAPLVFHGDLHNCTLPRVTSGPRLPTNA